MKTHPSPAQIAAALKGTDTQVEKLNAFGEWMVLRKQLPTGPSTIKLWCEYNWPEATNDDREYLWLNHGAVVRIAA